MPLGKYQYWDLLYPPPPMESHEDPRVEYNTPGRAELRDSGEYIDDITGFGMLSWERGEQDGWTKNANDPGSWEQRPSMETRFSSQVRPFGAGDNG